eukprot:COSAG02_NODE_29942_length_560_cov_0.744035_1_plen_92_part_10
MRAVGLAANYKTTGSAIQALELCISDKNKPLLIANEKFIPYLVDALQVDPAHPRAGDKEEQRCWCQTHHAEYEFLAHIIGFCLSSHFRAWNA